MMGKDVHASLQGYTATPMRRIYAWFLPCMIWASLLLAFINHPVARFIMIILGSVTALYAVWFVRRMLQTIAEHHYYKILVDSVPDQLYLKDMQGRFLIANKATTDRYKQFSSITGKTDFDLFPNTHAARFWLGEQKVLQGELLTHNIADASTNPDNLSVDVKWPVYDGAGNIIGLVGTSKDTSYHHAIEGSLQQVNRHLHATLEALPVLIFEISREGLLRDLHVNNAAMLSGLPESWNQKSIYELLPPTANTIIQEGLVQCSTAGETVIVEFSTQDIYSENAGQIAQATWYECHISTKQITWEKDESYILFVHDISERKRAIIEQSRLFEAEREQRLIAETLTELMLALTSRTSQGAIMEELLRQVGRVVTYRTAHISLIDGEHMRLIQFSGEPEFGSFEIVEKNFQKNPLTTFPAYPIMVMTGLPLLLENTKDYDFWVSLPGSEWIKSHIMYPITWQDEGVQGVLMLDHDEPAIYTDTDIERLRPLVSAAAIALERTGLYENAQIEISERKNSERALHNVNEELEQRVSRRTQDLETANERLKNEIAEHLRTSEALYQSEALFRGAFTNVASGMALIGLDGQYLQVNQALCDMLGYDEQTLLSRHILDDAYPDDIAPNRSAFTAVLYGQPTVQVETRYQHEEGYPVWVFVSMSAIQDEDNTLLYVVVQIRDITDGKQAEVENQQLLQQLRHRNIQMQIALEISASANTILDPGILITQMVHRIQQGFNFYYVGLFLTDDTKREAVLRAETSTEEHTMHNSFTRQPLDGPSIVAQCITRCQAVIAQNIDDTVEHPGYNDLPLTRSEVALPLNTRRGCIGALSIHSKEPGTFNQEDLTALQTMVEQVGVAIENARLYNAAQEEIERRNEAERAITLLNENLEQHVKDRTAELEAANHELEAFAYSVSHDLRAPLRSIIGFSQALIEDYGDKLDGDGHDYLQRVQAASVRMGELIAALLELSRVTRTEMNRSTVDLSDIVANIATNLVETTTKGAAQFTIEPDVIVRGDPRLLRAALENLLSNAWKFTRKQAQPEITFGRSTKNGNPVYFVKDNGVGFNMAYANKLFSPFLRLHAADEFEGTGVGLATVQRIIHRHGGEVWAESEVDQGSTIYFTLP